MLEVRAVAVRPTGASPPRSPVLDDKLAAHARAAVGRATWTERWMRKCWMRRNDVAGPAVVSLRIARRSARWSRPRWTPQIRPVMDGAAQAAGSAATSPAGRSAVHRRDAPIPARRQAAARGEPDPQGVLRSHGRSLPRIGSTAGRSGTAALACSPRVTAGADEAVISWPR